MIAILSILLQAATSTSQPPQRIDLLDRCAKPSGDEILVCGNRAQGDRYRLRDLSADPALALPKAEMTLFGDTKAAIEAEAAEIAPGVVSNRLMLRLKTPF